MEGVYYTDLAKSYEMKKKVETKRLYYYFYYYVQI